MGNCQAAETATVVIQHPGGRVERMYWPVSASEVMSENPGHYVALIITFSISEERQAKGSGSITRVKLLRPNDNLHFGQVYRLVTAQEVMKGLWEKKHGKTKTSRSYSREQHQMKCEQNEPRSELQEVNQVPKQDRHRHKQTHSSSKLGQWRPSLQSISEAGS